VRSALARVDGVTVEKVAMPDTAVVKVDRDKVTNEQLFVAVKSAGVRYSATAN
jgi:copper chaperone CopZ